jgi:uncharacterized paraquat-inducible protein A
MRTICQKCGGEFGFPKSYEGKEAKCPRCGEKISLFAVKKRAYPQVLDTISGWIVWTIIILFLIIFYSALGVITYTMWVDGTCSGIGMLVVLFIDVFFAGILLWRPIEWLSDLYDYKRFKRAQDRVARWEAEGL